VPLFIKQYNLVPCEGLHAKVPYCGSGIGSNEQGEYYRAVLKRFCRKEPRYKLSTLLYFFTFYSYSFTLIDGTGSVVKINKLLCLSALMLMVIFITSTLPMVTAFGIILVMSCSGKK